MRGLRYGRGFGFGHFFGLLFLVRHPLVFAVLVAALFAAYLYRNRR